MVGAVGGLGDGQRPVGESVGALVLALCQGEDGGVVEDGAKLRRLVSLPVAGGQSVDVGHQITPGSPAADVGGWIGWLCSFQPGQGGVPGGVPAGVVVVQAVADHRLEQPVHADCLGVVHPGSADHAVGGQYPQRLIPPLLIAFYGLVLVIFGREGAEQQAGDVAGGVAGQHPQQMLSSQAGPTVVVLQGCQVVVPQPGHDPLGLTAVREPRVRPRGLLA